MAIPPASLSFAKKRCRPCSGGTPRLSLSQAKIGVKKLDGWQLSKNTLDRDYVMKDFMAAIQLIGRIAKIAEKENHHPDLFLSSYRKLKVSLSTHSIGGLSENDFILAAKIDRLPKSLKINKI